MTIVIYILKTLFRRFYVDLSYCRSHLRAGKGLNGQILSKLQDEMAENGRFYVKTVKNSLKGHKNDIQKPSKTLDSTEIKSFPIGPSHSITLDLTKVKSFPIGPPHSKTLDLTKVKSFPIGPPHSKTLAFLMSGEKRAQSCHSPTSARTLEI